MDFRTIHVYLAKSYQPLKELIVAQTELSKFDHLNLEKAQMGLNIWLVHVSMEIVQVDSISEVVVGWDCHRTNTSFCKNGVFVKCFANYLLHIISKTFFTQSVQVTPFDALRPLPFTRLGIPPLALGAT